MQEVRTTTLPNGTVIQGRYTVEDLLGRGGFGAVYLVRDMRVRGNLFALKEAVDSNPADRERFIFEGEVLKRLDHPALTRVYRAFENDSGGRAYILMDYIEGPNLEILRHRQPQHRFDLAGVMGLISPIMDAVAYLHRQTPPIIHRDIKPANIIATGDETVLVDFGIAKEYDPDSTTTAIRRCSPGFGAPEQYSKGTDPRTDIYGLGATIYSLLTGTIPADALYRLTQVSSSGTDPLEPIVLLNPTISPEVADVVQHAMAIDINIRFATVEAFWHALQAAAGTLPPGRPIVGLASADMGASAFQASPSSDIDEVTTRMPGSASRPAPIISTTRQPGSRRRAIALLLFVLAVLLVGGGAYAFATLRNASNAPSQNTATTVATQTSQAAQQATTTAQQNAQARSLTATAIARAQSASATPPATATQPPATPTASYPQLTGNYNGSLHNDLANVNGSMTLSQIKQTQGEISGYFSVSGPQLIGSGPFTGSVSTRSQIAFTVTSTNVRPLYFTGTIHSDGSMNGTYCSLNQANQCDRSVGGYGSWHVTPGNPGSASLLKPDLAAYERRM